MKRILRHFVIDTFSLWAVSNIARGMVFQNGLETLIATGLAVTATFLLAKPIINLLLLPLNLVTFGLFRWVSSAVVLYIVTLIIKDFRITAFHFGGLTSKWIDVPSLNFSGLLAFVGFSFLLSLITSFIYWLIK
ncbi:MAG: hypothetical protein UT24_C0012G0148 [Candidatus Woesebacteria bacterium GW2011_GWB1_39_12]|uniref:Phage holin family protein n=2 Tax=Candidatus Woeseibacteriota TaxID=1752722 RepID=A0A0G0M2N3_9BACT|nr:MAG: hypothetical protein UT23_C0011G0023 [Candidatus Woesebacteria bacterium GW2011_GWA1_39_12]KKR00526.1 MAG: hypothetical protein UT24_C0012G0148 [Candidatus Woesebacteria bacterium GW2011_GWB1_39_12]